MPGQADRQAGPSTARRRRRDWAAGGPLPALIERNCVTCQYNGGSGPPRRPRPLAAGCRRRRLAALLVTARVSGTEGRRGGKGRRADVLPRSRRVPGANST